jgi:hypothetical protein
MTIARSLLLGESRTSFTRELSSKAGNWIKFRTSFAHIQGSTSVSDEASKLSSVETLNLEASQNTLMRHVLIVGLISFVCTLISVGVTVQSIYYFEHYGLDCARRRFIREKRLGRPVRCMNHEDCVKQQGLFQLNRDLWEQ